ncbi:MAG: hypothetical protein ACE5D8_10370, partial [Fidelibacterota bacterium]
MNTKDRILRRLLPFLLISVILSQPVISGYIKLDTYHDSHAVTAAREGHYALYPENSDPASRINFVLFQSRIRVSLPSQPFFTWSVAGFIEGDFFGTSNGRENQFRLRHSVITITNPTTRITLGQYWSPLFNEYVYPGTVSFNTGAPMQPFARMPQITVTKQVMSSFFLRLSATMQRDAFADIGGVEQQQASGRPGFHLHGWFQTPRFLLGTGLYQKSIQPEDAPSFPALAGTFYGKLSLDRFHIKWKYTRGEDLADHIMLGGYAILTDTLSGSMRSVPL